MEKVNNISVDEWIDINLKDCKDGLVSFVEAGQIIALHEKLDVFLVSNQRISIKHKSCVFDQVRHIDNPNAPKGITPEAVLEGIYKTTGFTTEALSTRSRVRELTEARFAFFLICLELKNNDRMYASLGYIGALVKRNHATVIHARTLEHIPAIQKIINDTKKILSV